MRKVAILFIIFIMGLLVACGSASPAPAPDSIIPEPLPSLTPLEPEYQEDSFTIRVTGNRLVFDQRERDRRWGEAKKLCDRLRDESYEREMEEWKACLELPFEERLERQAEVAEKGQAERDKIREDYFAVLHAPTDDLYSQSSVVKFSGSYMVITSDGGSTSRSVDGTTPAEYAVRGVIVSCAFQKMSESGSLKVEILKGGKVVNSSYTTAAYGIVSVATP